MKPLAIDLFSGCGGLSLGLSQAGFEHLFAIEHHPDAFGTYEQNLIAGKPYDGRWPKWMPKKNNDIRKVLRNQHDHLVALQGKVALVAGGPPCQGFTTNGRRDPSDPRSTMVDAYLDFVAAVQPRLVLLENVRGFASMPHPDGGHYPDHVQRRLDDLGYETWDTILTASDWGVPQRRPRYILIAAARGSLPGIDPIQRLRVGRRSFLTRVGLWPEPTTAKQALHDLEVNGAPTCPDREWGKAGYQALDYREPTQLSPFVQLMREGCNSAPTDLRLAKHSIQTTKRMAEILASCPRGRVIGTGDRERLGLRKRSTTPLDANAPAPTITTLPDDLIHYTEPRTMTVREHARLQSFPDWFSFTGRYTAGGLERRTSCPRYTQVGNAVPPLLARAIGEVLLSLLNDQNPMYLPDSLQLGEEPTSMGREILNGQKDIPVLV